jgi:hypothetical protein
MRVDELAKALGISRSMAYAHKKKGMPVHSIEAAKKWRAKYLTPEKTKQFRADGNTGGRSGRAPSHGDGRAGDTPTGDPDAGTVGRGADPGGERDGSLYWDAKTRREVAEATKAELQLAEMEGSFVKRDSVERAAYETGRLLRDMILSVPSRLATELSAMTEPQEVELRLRDELRKVLADLARLSRTGFEGVAG